MTRFLRRIGLLVALGLLVSGAGAQTINWGGALGDTLLQSDGTSELDGSFTIELGYFEGITPNGDLMDAGQNVQLWASSWRVFDRAAFNPTLNYFTGSATLLGDRTSSSAFADPSNFVFPQGGQAYVWVYNTKNPSYPGAEWALLTNDSSDGNAADDWLFPGLANDPPTDDTPLAGPRDLPLDWRLSLVASTPEFGGANDEQGNGEHTPPAGPFDLQTHTVPEPSAAWLGLLAGALALMRRRRVPS